MDELLSEKEQLEQIRTWWAENGRFVITGLVLGIAVLAGWRYWNHYKIERAEAASATFDQMIEAVDSGDRDTSAALAAQLETDYSATPYANDGALVLARLYMDLGDADAAAGVLRVLIGRAGSAQIGHLARLRLARVLVHQGKADEALPLVEGTNTGAFAARYAEVRGDVQLARGDLAAARDAYQSALNNAQPGLIDRAIVQMKFDETAAASAAASGGS